MQNKNTNSLSLDDLFSKIESGVKEINIILKADVKVVRKQLKMLLRKLMLRELKQLL